MILQDEDAIMFNEENPEHTKWFESRDERPFPIQMKRVIKFEWSKINRFASNSIQGQNDTLHLVQVCCRIDDRGELVQKVNGRWSRVFGRCSSALAAKIKSKEIEGSKPDFEAKRDTFCTEFFRDAYMEMLRTELSE